MAAKRKQPLDLHASVAVNVEIRRLIDRISKADEDERLLGYARQIRALLRGEFVRQEIDV